MYTQKNDDKNFRTGFFFFPMSQLSGSEVSMVVSRGTIQNLRFDQIFSNLLSILLYCEALLQIKVNLEFEKPSHSSLNVAFEWPSGSSLVHVYVS